MTSARFRLLCLLLVLANVVFFVYAKIANTSEDPASQIQRLQLHPEKIKLISRGDAIKPESLASTQAGAKPVVPCIEWGLFAGPAVARADAAVNRLSLPPDTVQRAVVDSGAYWVYIPPLKTKAEVNDAVEDLKARRVTDFFVVQDPPQWSNAISLGIFQTEESANSRLNALRDTGVHDAIMERRENFLRQVAYYVRQPSDATVARLTALQRDFPGSEVKAGPCPTGN
jgi:hypothetical protein